MCNVWRVVQSLCQKCTAFLKSTFPFLITFNLLFPSFSVPPALRVISCEASGVFLTVLPSPLWIQTPVAFGNAPLVITSCGAQPVHQQKDGKRPRWRYQSRWPRYQTKRMARAQLQQERVCQGGRQGWRSVSSPEGPSSTGLSPCP